METLITHYMQQGMKGIALISLTLLFAAGSLIAGKKAETTPATSYHSVTLDVTGMT